MVQATVTTTDDNELTSALYTVVRRLSRLPMDEPVDKAGLAVLHELHRLGTVVRPSDLAAKMHLDLSTISRHLCSLEQQGMVQRTRDPVDARAQQISLTVHGDEFVTRLLDHRSAKIRDAIADWPQSDRTTLSHLLVRLADDLSHPGEPRRPPATGEPAEVHETTETL
jgi:DNA-binding MarR family transcriptional regulator